jgi:hypothetical protein
MREKLPNPIDMHVGARVRMRRMMLGTSEPRFCLAGRPKKRDYSRQFGSHLENPRLSKDFGFSGGTPPGARPAIDFEQTMQFRDQHKERYSNGDAPLPAVSSNTLASCFGVSPKVIYDLAKAGIIERSSARLFPLEDSVRRYCEHLRRQAGG